MVIVRRHSISLWSPLAVGYITNSSSFFSFLFFLLLYWRMMGGLTPVTSAVALETLKIYQERNIVEQVNRISQRFQEGIKAFSDSPIIGEIRGTGLVSGIDLAENKSANNPFPPEWGLGKYFGAECRKNGLIVRAGGDNISMAPPLIISPEEVDEIISTFGKALKATEERVKQLKAQK